jgi:hypothetical protein
MPLAFLKILSDTIEYHKDEKMKNWKKIAPLFLVLLGAFVFFGCSGGGGDGDDGSYDVDFSVPTPSGGVYTVSDLDDDPNYGALTITLDTNGSDDFANHTLTLEIANGGPGGPLDFTYASENDLRTADNPFLGKWRWEEDGKGYIELVFTDDKVTIDNHIVEEYILEWGAFNATYAGVQSTISAQGWDVELADDGVYATGTTAEDIYTYSKNTISFIKTGSKDGTFEELLNYKSEGVGLPSNLKKHLRGEKANAPLAGIFDNGQSATVFYVKSKN